MPGSGRHCICPSFLILPVVLTPCFSSPSGEVPQEFCPNRAPVGGSTEGARGAMVVRATRSGMAAPRLRGLTLSTGADEARESGAGGRGSAPPGVAPAPRRDDVITSPHRGHGHILAKGGDPRRMMAELMGKASGYNRGRGGSLPIADLSPGI